MALFQKLAPEADEVKSKASTGIRFVDCGGNFERVLCPSCGAEIKTDWWRECMDEEMDANFRLRAIRLPCCGVERNLDELNHDWPQGFARFSVEAMNPNIEDLTEEHLRQFEAALGCKVRKMLQHL